MTDYLTRVCPNCGGRLCVNSSDPERVYCDTCEYEEPEIELDNEEIEGVAKK